MARRFTRHGLCAREIRCDFQVFVSIASSEIRVVASLAEYQPTQSIECDGFTNEQQ